MVKLLKFLILNFRPVSFKEFLQVGGVVVVCIGEMKHLFNYLFKEKWQHY